MIKNIHALGSRITLLIVAVFMFSANAHAIEIREIKSRSGITAYLVEDYTLPIISMAFSFEGGMVQDRDGKEGAVRLMTAMLDEGAGEYDSAAFRGILEKKGISLQFSSGREAITGGLRTLTTDRELAFDMLKLALNEPRFDNDPIERIRAAILQGLERAKTNPSAVASKTLRETLFEGHEYARAPGGDETSVAAIKREDLIDLHQSLFAKNNLSIGVVGAISSEELAKVLDQVFGDLPNTADLDPVEETNPILGKEVSVEMPVPNASISLVYKGLKRNSPDFFKAYLVDHILGGGTFSSRLYEEVREKRGLVYSVSSGISTLDHTAYLVIGTSVRAENQAETKAVIKEQVARLVSEGISAEELETAKKYVSGAYVINKLDTSGKIARVLVALQTEDLGIDYIDRRQQYIEDVTLEEANRLARELLSVEPTIVTVGPTVQN